MADISNIDQLKDHQEQPPLSLYDRIMNTVKAQEDKDALDLQLKDLGSMEIDPQEHQYAAISRAIKKEKSPLRHMIIRISAVAAVLFFFIAIWGILQNREMGSGVIKFAEQYRPAEKQVASNKTYPAPVSISEHRSLSADKKKHVLTPSLIQQYQPTISGTNETMSWVENDLFYTILNCRYVAIAPYFENESRQLIVNVDQFSTATVSDKMLQFMKTMYSTNKRSKPTRKARRASRKLEKWKKADALYFDQKNKHNPLDIIDITRFAAGGIEEEEQ